MPQPAAGQQPVFYYDLGDPECYLQAEQIMTALPLVPEFEPVLTAELLAPGSDAHAPLPEPDWERAARVALELDIQPLRRPDHWPPDTREAMLAATYAKRIGRAVAFSFAAFRQAFAGGRDLGDRDTVLIAGAACEMHPTALLKGIALRSTAEALDAANERARQARVTTLPAVQVGDSVFTELGAAARAMEPA